MMRSITSFGRRVTGDSASQRKWLMLRLVMLLFTAMTTSATWAADVTFNFTNQGAATQTATDGCKIEAEGTISDADPSLNKAYIKFPKGCTLTITAPTGKTINNIVINYVNSVGKVNNMASVTNGYTINTTSDNNTNTGNSIVSLGSEQTPSQTVIIKNNTTSSSDVYISTVDVTYTTSGGGSDPAPV